MIERNEYIFWDNTENRKDLRIIYMRPEANNMIRRTAISLILVIMLSFGTAFAYADDQTPAEGMGQNTEQTQEQPSQSGDQEVSGEQPQTVVPAPAPMPVSRIIKKGKYYYYKQSNGKIRKKAGFVTDLGNRYYVKKAERSLPAKPSR